MSLSGREGPMRGYVLASTFKTSSTSPVIPVTSGTLAFAIITCDTSIIVMKVGSCTVSCSLG